MAIDRAKFLKMCQKCAVLPEQFGIKRDVPDDLKIIYNDMEFYPQAYELYFGNKGNAIHTAILHDLNANSIIRIPLSAIYLTK